MIPGFSQGCCLAAGKLRIPHVFYDLSDDEDVVTVKCMRKDGRAVLKSGLKPKTLFK